MNREPLPTWFFVLSVVRSEGRFLLVQEARWGRSWYLPAGRVEPGEDLVTAARREAMEESGVPVEIDGIVRFEHTPSPDGSVRVRVFFTGHPEDDSEPKQKPEGGTLRAAWFTLDELKDLTLREEVVREVCEYVAVSGRIRPLDLLTAEGAPFVAEGSHAGRVVRGNST